MWCYEALRAFVTVPKCIDLTWKASAMSTNRGREDITTIYYTSVGRTFVRNKEIHMNWAEYNLQHKNILPNIFPNELGKISGKFNVFKLFSISEYIFPGHYVSSRQGRSDSYASTRLHKWPVSFKNTVSLFSPDQLLCDLHKNEGYKMGYESTWRYLLLKV